MKITALRAAIAFDGVDRNEPDGPPTAFRIWRAGDNTTDHGPTFFTERSAALLLEQQARRGNRYSIDVNHLSLDKSAPLENQRAVGWFDIEVRGGELWAVNVEWSDTVRGGLTKTPPEWRYHSPAYDVDANTGEVLSLTNLAITNNPATWSVTALASCGAQRSVSRMKLEDIKAAFEGADDEKKAAAWAAIAKAMASSDSDGDGDKDKPADEKKDSKKAAGDEPEKKDAEDAPEKKDGADEPEKKDTKATSDVASVLAAQDARLRKLEAENATLRKGKEDDERKALIASRVMSRELASALASKPLAVVKDICAAMPVKVETDTKSTETVTATRGASQNTPALPAEEKAELDRRMGIRKADTPIVKNEGVHQIFAAMPPSEARRLAASKGGK